MRRTAHRAAVAVLTFALLPALVGAAGTARAQEPAAPPSSAAAATAAEVAGAGTTVVLALSKTTVAYGAAVAATATVRTSPDGGTPTPAAEVDVRFERLVGSDWTVVRTVATNASGVATVAVRPDVGVSTYRAVVVDPPTAPAPPSNSAKVTVTRAVIKLTLSGGKLVRSETTTTLRLALTSPTLPRSLAPSITIRRRTAGGGWSSLVTTRVPVGTTVSLRVTPWRRTEYVALYPTVLRVTGTQSNVVVISTTPYAAVVRPIAGRPNPQVRFAAQPAPVGAGAHVVVSAIPNWVWARMYGVSWQRGCPVSRSGLRYLTVNYYGFDGYRHRGELVVAARHAPSATAVLNALYAIRYPVRQMRLVDDFGRGPYRGANDYASMAADNTSGFNCRYVVGKETSRVLSPHSYGGSIDINPWENPYVARTGVFPNRAWLPRSTAHPAVLNGSSDPAVRAFTARGFRWGGAYRDYHHFQRSSSAPSGALRAAEDELVPWETHGQPFVTPPP